MRTVICVPWRGGSPSREFIWQKVRANYEQYGLEVFTGDSDPDKPFNRSAARNAAARNAGVADVYCFLDADTFVPADQLFAAIKYAHLTGTVALPYNVIKGMNPATGGTRERVQLGSTPYMTSGNVVVSRSAWKHLTWDERLCDWGWEDGAFLKAANTLAGPVVSIPGTLITIDHARRPDEVAEEVIFNRERPEVLAEYDYATTPKKMRALMKRARVLQSQGQGEHPATTPE